MINTAKTYFGLILVLCLYFIIGTLFVSYTPAWQTPDEPAHYNYIAQLATQGCCPTIEQGDWDLTYLQQLTSNRFSPHLLENLHTIQYEDHQPPLYYLLATPIFLLTNGSLKAVRFLSLIIGSGIILSSYFIAHTLFPKRPWVAIGTALLIAFLPQKLHILTSANNDALAWTLIALTLLVLILYLKNKHIGNLSLNRFGPLMLGLLVGLAFLTKATAYFLAAPVLLAIYLHWRETSPPLAIKTLIQNWMQFLIPSLFLGSLWWIRNLNVYGLLDFMGLQAHDHVVVGQMRTAEYIAQVGWQTYLSNIVETTYTSFLGQFGWMALPLRGWPMFILTGLLLVAISGWGIRWLRYYGQNKQKGNLLQHTSSWQVLTLTLILTIVAYIGYNLSFLQHQGRYLYSGLIPVALFIALGFEAWGATLTRITPQAKQLSYWLAISPLMLLPLLDIYILWRIIIPGLTP